MNIKFPLLLSKFVRKRNAAYDGDPNGDYVMAEDVNEIQESVERLEQVIGIEQLDKPVVEILYDKADLSSVNDFGSPLFVTYRGSSLNAYDSIEQRINALSYLPYAIIKQENTSDFNYLIQEVRRSGTKLYGFIDCLDKELNVIEAEAIWFKEKRFHGVMLENFGFENGMTRGAQNELLKNIHGLGLNVIITGEIETTLFNKPSPNNPLQEPINLAENDMYLAQDIFIKDGVKHSSDISSTNAFQLNKAQKDLSIKIFVEDTANFSIDNTSLYLHGKMMATLYNLDGYSLAPQSRYALDESIQKFVHGFELGEWKNENPIFVNTPSKISRSFSKGTLEFDKVTNTCYAKGVGLSKNIYTWQDKQIPGTAVDFETADYTSGAVSNIVESINDNSHQIHYSKIKGLSSSGVSPEMLKEHVVRSINVSPAAILKNGPDGYEAIAGNDFIHGGVIDYIDAGSIKSGTLNVDHIRANVIDAINAYIGTAQIDSAHIGKLTAEHIQADVVEAINLYAENAGINRAVINSAVIGDLTSDHIKTAVIEAINANIGNAFINGAIINEGSINSAQIADGSITDAKIVDLTASKLTAGTINTGQVTLQGENANLRIVGNKLQVFDNQTVPVERVVLGDVNNDGLTFGFRVRGSDGVTVLYDEKGVYNEGITDGAITNPKISDGAVENKHIVANTITGDKLVVNAITAREIAAKTITANEIMANSITAAEMVVGTITAESGIIGEAAIVRGNIKGAAIGSAQIEDASIVDAHIKNLNADKINAGKVKAEFIQVGPNTDFALGYSPDDLRAEMENRIPYRVEIISSNGIAFKNGNISTTLTARLYKGSEDITALIPAIRFNWTRISNDGKSDIEWNNKHKGVKEVTLTGDDVYRRTSFLCSVSDS